MKRAALVLATSVALLLSGVSVSAHAATRKYVSMPSDSQVVGSGRGSSVSGDLLTVPGDPLDGEYIPSSYGGGSKGTKLPVQPQYQYVKSRTIKGMVGNLRGGVYGVVIGVGLQYLLDQVDGFIDENGQAMKPGDQTIDGQPIKDQFSKDPSQICSLPASETIGSYFIYDHNGVKWSVTVVKHKSSIPSGYAISNNCTNESLGYNWQLNADASWPVAVKRQITSPSEIVSGGPVPLTEADYDLMEAAAAAKDSEWLKERLREHCEGSLNPQGCYESLRDNTWLEGPASVNEPGPTTTTVGPSGTTTTNSNTKIDITYGDNYYDYRTTKTTVVTKPDGTTETTTETEPDTEEPKEEQPEEMPAVTDLYKPYIDKLNDIKTDVSAPPAVVSPIGWSAWYSFGGGCSEITAELPVIGSWTTNYCPYIYDWVRPILAFIFVVFTWHYCRELWSEAVTQARPM